MWDICQCIVRHLILSIYLLNVTLLELPRYFSLKLSFCYKQSLNDSEMFNVVVPLFYTEKVILFLWNSKKKKKEKEKEKIGYSSGRLI